MDGGPSESAASVQVRNPHSSCHAVGVTGTDCTVGRQLARGSRTFTIDVELSSGGPSWRVPLLMCATTASVTGPRGASGQSGAGQPGKADSVVISGWCHTVVEQGGKTAGLCAHVAWGWTVSAGFHLEPVALDASATWPAVEEVVEEVVKNAAASPDSADPTADSDLGLAKALAEASRNSAVQLSFIRESLEDEVARAVRTGVDGDYALADVLEYSLLTSRSARIFRESAREGLWVWESTDSDHADAYQLLRRAMDATLPPAGRDLHSTLNARTYRAAVDQCSKGEVRLSEELQTSRSLLDAVATLAANREATAQERLNLFAAIGGFGLGLPALILTLFGAQAILPDGIQRPWIGYLALFLTTGATAVVAYRVRQGTTAERRKSAAFVFLLGALLVGLLAATAELLTPSSDLLRERGTAPAPSAPTSPAAATPQP